jgi:hypothetical protein
MARRVRQSPSRGSKKRPSSVLPKDVIDPAKSASLSEASTSLYPGGPETLVALDVDREMHDERNGNEDPQSDNVVESQINGLTQSGESAQPDPGNVFLLPGDSADSDFIVAESFDEAGYLRLNPDVRRAIELGHVASAYAHYLLYGKFEGRALPDTPREARNIMLATPHDEARADVFPKEARCSIEALIIAPMGGLMIVGWIDDVSHPLSCIRILGPDWRVVMDATRIVRVRRTDVENAVGGRRLHAFGFVGFVHFDRGG